MADSKDSGADSKDSGADSKNSGTNTQHGGGAYNPQVQGNITGGKVDMGFQARDTSTVTINGERPGNPVKSGEGNPGNPVKSGEDNPGTRFPGPAHFLVNKTQDSSKNKK